MKGNGWVEIVLVMKMRGVVEEADEMGRWRGKGFD